METVWRKYFTAMNNDRRINVWHLTLFMTLVCYWEIGGCKNPISITRREVDENVSFRLFTNLS
jgi:hypothetical protein